MRQRERTIVRFVRDEPGGGNNAGDVAGLPSAKAERLMKRGYVVPAQTEEPAPEPEEQRPLKRKPKGLDRIDRMASPDVERA